MAITPKAIANVSAPNTITGVADAASSLKNARIGYKNLLVGTINEPEGDPMLTPNTYERYRTLTGSFTLKFQLATSATVDFVGLAAHNLGTHDDGIPVTVKYATVIGGALTTIDTIQFSENNDARMLIFDPIVVAEIAISFTTTTGLEIGIIYAGEALEMQRPIYGGHSPITLSSETSYQSPMSETGQFLGRTIIREGISTTFSWQHLDPDWYREKFQPFVQSAKKLPFFIKWRPDLYDETAFGFTTADIKPSNMGGGHRLMTASFDMNGHSDAS